MSHALLISQQQPMKVKLSVALYAALQERDTCAKARVTAMKYAEFERQDCPQGIDVVVIDVDPVLVRAALLKIRQLNLGVPILCFYPQESELIKKSLLEVDATAVLMLPPSQVEKSAEPYYAFFTECMQPLEVLAEVA